MVFKKQMVDMDNYWCLLDISSYNLNLLLIKKQKQLTFHAFN
jgi:hypothetical protein